MTYGEACGRWFISNDLNIITVTSGQRLDSSFVRIVNLSRGWHSVPFRKELVFPINNYREISIPLKELICP